MDLLQTIAASRMLRRRIPQSGHLMTAKRFWLQTVPCNVSSYDNMTTCQDDNVDNVDNMMTGLRHSAHAPPRHGRGRGLVAPGQAAGGGGGPAERHHQV